MMIFEVAIKEKFLLNRKFPYLSKTELKKIAKLNNVFINDAIVEDKTFPIWKIFEIQLKEFRNITLLHADFIKYIDCFEEVTNSFNKEIEDFKLLIKVQRYKEFLQYLINLHNKFKRNEQYKLMWSLESTYIREVIYILIDNGVKYDNLVNITNHIEENYLYTIYKGDDYNYFVSESNYFKNTIELFNSKFSLDNNKCFELLFSNEKYYDTLHTIIEIKQRIIQSKYSKHILLSLVRGIVLNVEELIKDSMKIYKNKQNSKNKYVIDNIKNEYFVQKGKCSGNVTTSVLNDMKIDLYKYISFLSNIPKLERIRDDFNNTEFFKNILPINKIITKEKYFYIFHKTRNHIAHNHIDFNMLFKGKCQKISIILDSVVFILMYLEYLKQDDRV